MSSLNISPYLFGVGNTTNRSRGSSGTSSAPSGASGLFSTFQFGNTLGSSGATDTTGWFSSSDRWAPLKRVLTYLMLVLIVISILLLFVHFFIRPVFKWKPGSPGWIPVPGWDDGILFWKDGNTGPIKNEDLPILNDAFNYTVQVDMLIQNPLQFASHPRLLLTRGAIKKATPSGDTILGVLDQYNFAVALKPDTNDMIVSVLNKDNQMESVILPNVPVQEPFRLTMVIMEKALEVYLNGHLVKTTTFHASPRDVRGGIYPASGVEANIAKYRNLKVWSRVLTTPEIRDSTPSLDPSDKWGAGPIPSSSSSSCPSNE